MTQFYTDPSRESEPHALPNGLVEYQPAGEMAEALGYDENHQDDETPEEFAPAGFYVCSCFPGCMPDSEWSGPFDTEDEAIAEWRGMFED